MAIEMLSSFADQLVLKEILLHDAHNAYYRLVLNLKLNHSVLLLCLVLAFYCKF